MTWPDNRESALFVRVRTGRGLDCDEIVAHDARDAFRVGTAMAGITIRYLDDQLKHRLRVRAAEHGRSMEEEVREILRQVVGGPAPRQNLAAAVRTRFAPFAGEGLEIPPREPMRDPPTFDQAVRWSSSTRISFRRCCAPCRSRRSKRGLPSRVRSTST